jgi:aspartyl-tRNA synthetase
VALREFDVMSKGDATRRYVLPQSSQVYRTLFMVGGIERYYQITRNFRDEWMRGNRQFEFSVLDLEGPSSRAKTSWAGSKLP